MYQKVHLKQFLQSFLRHVKRHKLEFMQWFKIEKFPFQIFLKIRRSRLQETVLPYHLNIFFCQDNTFSFGLWLYKRKLIRCCITWTRFSKQIILYLFIGQCATYLHIKPLHMIRIFVTATNIFILKMNFPSNVKCTYM